MTTPTGTISLGDVNIELSKLPTALISLNDADVRTLAGILSGQISMNDLRGKSSINTITYGWGRNFNGQLGNNTIITGSSPVIVVGGFTDWTQVSAGSTHTAAVRNNGTAWTWGNNNYGQLGENTAGAANVRSSPVSVVGGFTDWKQISSTTSSSSTGAVRNNGTAWTWGRNLFGNLGINNSIHQSSPVIVVGGITDWKQISAGYRNTGAVRNNGTAWCWGSNFYGGCGDGTTVSKSSPVIVVGGFTDWKEISTGEGHVLAVRNNGTAWTWGVAQFGRLGDNTLVNKSSPVIVVGGFTDWTQVSAGRRASSGVRTNGTAWGWGWNFFGEIGDGTRTQRNSPVSVVGGFTDWKQISSGYGNTAAIRNNGTAWAWGNNLNGRLGDNTLISRSSPVSVVGGFTDWKMISMSNHTAAIRGTGL